MQIDHWSGKGTIALIESTGGVKAVVNPLDNLVRAGVTLWPPPEIIQKLCASGRWVGKGPDDDLNARKSIGHYCYLQSLNSEGAITWSFFGPFAYGSHKSKTHFVNCLLELLGFPTSDYNNIWLWRRIPHPEKPTSSDGPEIDFGIMTDCCVVLGESKWNSSLGIGQGVEHNRSQLDLRKLYCTSIGRMALPNTAHWAVVGVGRDSNVLGMVCASDTGSDATVCSTTWRALLEFLPPDLRVELTQYLDWKERYSSKHA